MIQQVLTPGMQDGEEADLGSQMPRIASNAEQGLGSGGEQNVVEYRLVIESDAGDFLRDGENDMEVGRRQQLRLAALQPLGTLAILALRAVAVAAGVISNADMRALAALFDMAAQSGSTANLNGAHHAQLLSCESV